MPSPSTRGFAERGKSEEITGTEVDRRIGARSSGAPRGFKELPVRLAKAHGAGDRALGIDERDGGAYRQEGNERNQLIDQSRRK